MQAREKHARKKSDYAIAKEDYATLKEASETPDTISPLNLATVKSKAEACDSLRNMEKQTDKYKMVK